MHGQLEDDQLSRQSWVWIQEWMAQTVKLSTEEALDAIFVFMAIHALGKITEFREELVPGYDAHMHDVALAIILEANPQVVPSFSRLSSKYQRLIVDSLSVDFQFQQFLQAECTPANLVIMKEKLKPHGDDGFAFFLFRIFAQMCGKLGAKSLRGSLFMTESQFQRFRPGLDALQQLRTLDAAAAYNAFLLLRGSQAMSRFASPEHQALARLLCLGEAFDYEDGNHVCEAFDELLPGERAVLTRWLNSDGIHYNPGYVLCHAPNLLANAKKNQHVGLTAALRMMLKVYEMCTDSSAPSKVVVHLNELALWAKEAGPENGDFLSASLCFRSDTQGETRVVNVELIRPDSESRSYPEGHVLNLGSSRPCAWTFMMTILVLACLSCVGMAACLRYAPEVVPRATPDDVVKHRRSATDVLIVSACAISLLLCLCCCCRRYCQSKSVAISCTDAGPRAPFLERGGYSRLRQEEDPDV